VNRRAFLAGGLASGHLLPGCLTVSDGGTTPTQRMVSVSGRDEPPDLPVHPSVEVVQPLSSDAGPPELVASVANTADHPIEVGEERAIVFAYVSSEDRPGLTLVPTTDEPEPVEPGCWRLADAIAIPEYYGIVTLAPGEATERQLGVWASSDGGACLPTGEFRFQTQYAGARDRSEGVEDQEWSGRWGFTVSVE
jgi:hypothetical protein